MPVTSGQLYNIVKIKPIKTVQTQQVFKAEEVSVSVVNIEKNQHHVIELMSADTLLNINANNIKIESFQNKVNDIRNKMPTLKLQNQGNMAFADVNIEGLPNEFLAHSKIHNSSSNGADIANFSYTQENKLFESYVIDKFPRYNDTEAKILEDIASRIKNPNVHGQVDLYTELPACQSCSNVILEFRQKYPNIKLNIYTQ